jgi:hypothetical protein
MPNVYQRRKAASATADRERVYAPPVRILCLDLGLGFYLGFEICLEFVRRGGLVLGVSAVYFPKNIFKEQSKAVLVSRAGLEPATLCLKGRCSTS